MLPTSPDYERIKLYYEYGWATKEDIAMYVFYEKITPEEYELITGDPYVPIEQ